MSQSAQAHGLAKLSSTNMEPLMRSTYNPVTPIGPSSFRSETIPSRGFVANEIQVGMAERGVEDVVQGISRSVSKS